MELVQMLVKHGVRVEAQFEEVGFHGIDQIDRNGAIETMAIRIGDRAIVVEKIAGFALLLLFWSCVKMLGEYRRWEFCVLRRI
uniref:Uncharacterized protein n=1 Tax=Nelumbo nucifera TaxID=4432 RepID=A0A822ZV80_NELNU|nr:TPA_asm: hypothetical protein HUJ06_018724 [Nelumbo nucifera]